MFSSWNTACILTLHFLTKSSIFIDGQSDTIGLGTFHCNQEWCNTVPTIKCSEKPLNCTTIGFRTMLSPEPCNCCPYCFDYINENSQCQKVLSTTVPPTQICGNQLQCKTEFLTKEDKCVKMERGVGPCTDEFADYDEKLINGTVGISQFKPDCDAHGFYNPRQCLPGSICFCMSDIGERIFGVGFTNDPMDCACSRDVARLKAFGFKGTFPHCLSNGDYDEVQCSVYTRSCYCRNKPAETVAIQNLEKLSCFNKNFHPTFPETPYLHPCEIARSEINYESLQVKLNDSSILISDQPICAPDGNYDLIQSRNQKWICVDPSGEQIESFEAEKTGPTPGNMNCYCALIWFISSTSTGKPKCCPNGNFNKWQCSSSICYCVDALGRQDMKHKEVQIDDVRLLPCYKNAC